MLRPCRCAHLLIHGTYNLQTPYRQGNLIHCKCLVLELHSLLQQRNKVFICGWAAEMGWSMWSYFSPRWHDEAHKSNGTLLTQSCRDQVHKELHNKVTWKSLHWKKRQSDGWHSNVERQCCWAVKAKSLSVKPFVATIRFLSLVHTIAATSFRQHHGSEIHY